MPVLRSDSASCLSIPSVFLLVLFACLRSKLRLGVLGDLHHLFTDEVERLEVAVHHANDAVGRDEEGYEDEARHARIEAQPFTGHVARDDPDEHQERSFVTKKVGRNARGRGGARITKEAFYKDCAKVPVIELHDVYFDFDKSTLRPEGKAALDKALTVIKANHGEDRVTVVGWTDSMGTDAYNLRLSLRRAEAVKAYLAEKGIALDKLASEGRGESFKYNNGTEEGRQQNRRVELHFEQ